MPHQFGALLFFLARFSIERFLAKDRSTVPTLLLHSIPAFPEVEESMNDQLFKLFIWTYLYKVFVS